MLCGIVFGEKEKDESSVAFLSDEIESFTVDSNKEIVELVKERKPDIIAVNTSLEERRRLSDGEEELQEEGFIFTPAKDDVKRVRRFQSFKAHLAQELSGDELPEYIRFDPVISGRELAIDSDDAFEGYGVNPSDIDSAAEFDAALGAVTARFFQENQVRDLSVSVPEPIREKKDEEIEKDPREGETEKIPDPEEAS